MDLIALHLALASAIFNSMETMLRIPFERDMSSILEIGRISKAQWCIPSGKAYQRVIGARVEEVCRCSMTFDL
jgi:hypothetical protein